MMRCLSPSSTFVRRALVLASLIFLTQPALSVDIPFSEAQPLGVAIGHASLADIDDDGDLDWLGEIGSEIAWLEDGSTQQTIGVSTDAGSVIAADLDGDGDLDVLAAFTTPAEIVWWENTAGDGSTWSRYSVGVGSRAGAGDFDRDGDLDIAVIATNLEWLENTAGDASAWSAQTIDAVTVPGEITVSDLDGDGDQDLVGWGDDLRWWQNSSDGASWTALEIETGVNAAGSVALADVDRDGDLDVLASTFIGSSASTVAGASHRLGWWENTAGDASTWSEIHLRSQGNPSSVRAADLDGDGDVDFVLAIEFGIFEWWQNLGPGSWSQHRIAGPSSFLGTPLVDDFDRDGDLDVAAFESDVPDVITGTLRFENQTLHRNATYPVLTSIDAAFPNALSVAIADFDGDGDPDVAAGSSVGQLSWWQNDSGDASAWTEHTVTTNLFEARRLAAADLDGDGDADLLSGSASEGGVRWWQNGGDGMTWTARLVTDNFFDISSVRAADLDGDGDLDVIASSFNGGVRWWENAAAVPGGNESNQPAKADGDGTTWIERNTVGAIYAQGFDVADFDGDGDLDLLVPEYFGGAIRWWENSAGDGSAWSAQDVVTGVDSPTDVRAADLNGDGHADVIGVIEGDTDIWRWQNDGSGGGWNARIVSINLTRDLDVADLNADGDLDVFGPQEVNERLAWWRNADDGFNWFTNIATNGFTGGLSARAVDLDGDGDLDLVAAAQTDGAVAWWPNLGGQAELRTDNAAPTGDRPPGTEDVLLLDIELRHHGRFGDGEIELSELVLLFESTPGVTLSDSEMNSLISELRLYRDDGDGDFDPSDTLLHTASAPFALSAGVLSLQITDGADAAALAFEEDDVIFGAAHFFLAADIASFTSPPGPPFSTFRVSHLVGAHNAQYSEVQMRSKDLPLSLADPRDGNSSLVIIETEPDVLVTPTQLSFGRQAISAGPSATLAVTIENLGSEVLTPVSVMLSGPDFTISSDSSELSVLPGQTRTVDISFDPSTIGTKSSELFVLSNDPDAGFLVVDLSGQGTDPKIDVMPAAVEFGEVEVGVPSDYQTVTLTSEGTTSLEILALELVGDEPGSFEIQDASPGFIGVGGTRTVEVRFIPDGSGARSAKLRITSDDADEGVLDVDLGGFGAQFIFVDGFESGDVSAWSSSLP